MSLLNFFTRRTTAPVARERLQILLAHERSVVGGKPDLVALLREEILAVIAKHINVDPNCVKIAMERGSHVSTLEVDVEIPTAIAA